jgi:hypothetical protein
MTAERMSKLADQYSSSSGLVDYMRCFREFLTDITVNNFPIKNDVDTPYRAQITHQARDKGSSHPWEFQYKRETRHAMPYWVTANTVKEILPYDAVSSIILPAANEKATSKYSDAEKEALFAQYTPKVLHICSKCYVALF